MTTPDIDTKDRSRLQPRTIKLTEETWAALRSARDQSDGDFEALMARYLASASLTPTDATFKEVTARVSRAFEKILGEIKVAYEQAQDVSEQAQAKYDTDVAAKQATIDRLQTALTEAETDRTQLIETYEQASKMLEKREQQHQIEINDLDIKYMKEIDAAQDRYAEAEKKSAEMSAQYIARISDLSAATKSQQSQIEDLRKMLADAETKIGSMSAQLSGYEDTKQALTAAKDREQDLQHQLDRVNDRLASVDDYVAEIKENAAERIAAAEKAAAKAEDAAARAEKRYEELLKRFWDLKNGQPE